MQTFEQYIDGFIEDMRVYHAGKEQIEMEKRGVCEGEGEEPVKEAQDKQEQSQQSQQQSQQQSCGTDLVSKMAEEVRKK